MRKAVSQIAWPVACEIERVFPLLHSYGIEGIEVAPSKIWPNWIIPSMQEVARYRQKLKNSGFAIPAMQALFFGKPECKLFGTAEEVTQFKDHFLLVGRIAEQLECPVVVFGSPKNRVRGPLFDREAREQASTVFRDIADNLQKRGVTIGLEANPVQYGCDFITTSAECLEFVRHCEHANIRTHLDTGQLLMSGESVPASMNQVHCHLSEPYLNPLTSESIAKLKGIAGLAKGLDWCSVEMKETGTWLPALENSLRLWSDHS